MVSTRKNPRAASGSEEPRPTTSSPSSPSSPSSSSSSPSFPRKQTQKKAASASPTRMKSRATPRSKRKPEELAPGSSKGGRPVKQLKTAVIEDPGEDQPKKALKQATFSQKAAPDKLQEEKAGDIEEGTKGETKGAEIVEATDLNAIEKKAKEAEEDKSGDQLKAESKSAVSVSSAREDKIKGSSIMEKGMVYFFFRSKVAVEHAESLDDVQRSYIVLRPLLLGAELKDGKVQDEGRNRLVVVPKKKLPSKGTFVEEPRISIADLKDKFLRGSTYMTETQGERTNSAMEPIGEGIYIITKSENKRPSHLAYIPTLPQTPGELQKEFGLKERGSFMVNVRNPETPAPPQAGIPDPAEFSKEIMDEFRGLKWGALEPKHLDYRHAEVLFIGEEHIPEEGGHEAIIEEIEKLGGEDEVRVEHLYGNEAVFADLELDKKEFAGIESSW